MRSKVSNDKPNDNSAMDRTKREFLAIAIGLQVIELATLPVTAHLCSLKHSVSVVSEPVVYCVACLA